MKYATPNKQATDLRKLMILSREQRLLMLWLFDLADD